MSDFLQSHGLQHTRLPCLHYLPKVLRFMSTNLMMLSNHIIPQMHPSPFAFNIQRIKKIIVYQYILYEINQP